MARTCLGGGVVAVLLVILAGCKITDTYTVGLFRSGPEGEQAIVLTGSVDTVVQMVQAKLQEFGFATETSRQGDEVRITCSPKNGGKFYLLVAKMKSKEGERTRVRLDWEASTDKQAGIAMLAQLTADVALQRR